MENFRTSLHGRMFELLKDSAELLPLLSIGDFATYHLGSGPNGETVSRVMCANLNLHEVGLTPCGNLGLLSCAKCHLVKYCSKGCQTLHWSNHRKDCNHFYLKTDWQPAWAAEGRRPAFTTRSTSHIPFGGTGHCLWGAGPAVDCLQIPHNEGLSAAGTDFKLCFVASGDIRNLVRTVNSLPSDYSGKCDILLNDMDPIVAHRNIVILFSLLTDGPSVEEAAEFATHLMYSSALPKTSLIHLYSCISALYCPEGLEPETIFTGSLRTRGKGALHLKYLVQGMGDFQKMCLSDYGLQDALKGLHDTMLSQERVDYRDRYLLGLKPGHRMAFLNFLRSGILAPFGADIRHFVHPNRLMFSPRGEWMTRDNANPLNGWDISAVRASGRRHGVDPADIFGCLFFHVKDEFQEFARRITTFDIDIHLTQFDATLLASLIPTGCFSPFHIQCFDRVETSNIVDYIGFPRVLDDWGPLLSRDNKCASLLAYSTNWHINRSNASTLSNDRVKAKLIRPCMDSLGLDLTTLRDNKPNMLRLDKALDVFYDNDQAFQEYLLDQEADTTAATNELRRRVTHHVHQNRFGISLDATGQKVPNLSQQDFYDIFTIGGGEALVRFMEFECDLA